jgi:hypothetical protein
MDPKDNVQTHIDALVDIVGAYCYELERTGCGLFATARRARGFAALQGLADAIDELKKSRAATTEELEAARKALARYRGPDQD